MAKNQEGQSFAYKWLQEDNLLVLTMISLGSSTSWRDLTRSLIHSICGSTRTTEAIWLVTAENDEVLKAARNDKVEILHVDQVLSGWLAQATNLTDPFFYVVYHCKPSDPAQSDLPLPDNCPFFGQLALDSEAPYICFYDIDDDEDVEDSVFTEQP
jgi:hypothetical protein